MQWKIAFRGKIAAAGDGVKPKEPERLPLKKD
jgi:hypothetical protein